MEKHISMTLHLVGGSLALQEISGNTTNRKDEKNTCCTHQALEAYMPGKVPASVLGYWVDLVDYRGVVLYRQFLNHRIPLNIEYVSKSWSGLRKRRAIYAVTLPALENTHSIILYEQSRLASHTDAQRREHLNLLTSEYRVKKSLLKIA